MFCIADTNAVVRILNNDPTAVAFIEYMVTNGGVLCISEKTFEEVHIIHDSKEVSKLNNLSVQRNQQILLSAKNAKADLAIILNSDIFYPTPLPITREDKLEYITQLRIEQRLCWPDAYILATALENGVPLLWTHDSDFAFCKVPGVSIITDLSTVKNFKKTGMVHHKFMGFK